MRVAKCPSDTLSMTNRVVVNTEDWDPATTPHLQAGATHLAAPSTLYPNWTFGGWEASQNLETTQIYDSLCCE